VFLKGGEKKEMVIPSSQFHGSSGSVVVTMMTLMISNLQVLVVAAKGIIGHPLLIVGLHEGPCCVNLFVEHP
jgi:hypothetical protein